jgi:hypothetical protein
MTESLVAAVDTSHTDLSADTVSEVSEFGAVTEQVRIAVAVAFCPERYVLNGPETGMRPIELGVDGG